MNDVEERLSELLGSKASGVRPPFELSEKAPSKVRRFKTRRRAGVAMVSVLIAAGIVLPLKAMLPLADRHKIVPGGQPNSVATLPSNGLIAFSAFPEGEKFTQIFTVDPATGKVKRLTDVQGYATNPSWSPDGTGVAYFASDGSTGSKLFITDATGGETRTIPTPDGFGFYPQWSPDGSRILFGHSSAAPSDGLWTSDLITGGLRQVLPVGSQLGPGYPENAIWSPDGRDIYFDISVPYPTGLKRQIAVMPAAGGTPRFLMPSEERTLQVFPSVSPDGTTLLYSDILQQPQPALRLLNLATGAERSLAVTGMGGVLPQNAVWSPDGSEIVFQQDGKVGIIDPSTGDITIVLDMSEVSTIARPGPEVPTVSWQPVPRDPLAP